MEVHINKKFNYTQKIIPHLAKWPQEFNYFFPAKEILREGKTIKKRLLPYIPTEKSSKVHSLK
jgi:hypothetical protein